MIYSMLVCPSGFFFFFFPHWLSLSPEDRAARLSFSPADLFFCLTI